ncbi:GNAT family N-acetyltransferase [Leekyejoonella antrihumi]|uniref:GNAT family N-acetyltransferase n=1 Tax=Leekyejoonella antrihumi TaxID=1660198 RepID=A0A563E088_9MICO|nr:GNAT family N-acetyltransferase [Leekyejoonella antrihumi]TWP35926.1 GNAT family N-acetyltransferase [Leekyejoonella antrihumi]
MLEVRKATAQDRRAISVVLAAAFADDPVVRWLMPKPRRDIQMFRALTLHLHAAPGCADIASDNGEPVGAALWDPPVHSVSMRQGLVGLSRLFFAMGSGYRRGVELERAFTRARPSGQFWYLAAIGAPTPGTGAGSALLEQRLASIDGPAYLESSNQRNVPLYQRFGFAVIQEISLPENGPTLWTMLRS